MSKVLIDDYSRSSSRLGVISTLILIACLASKQTHADKLDQYLEQKMLEQKIPGLQIAVIKNEKLIIARSYGLANLQDSVAVKNDTVFTINSMTKGFTGVAIMQLAEQGKLDLSASISTYLEDLPVQWRTITVKQLLTHTSGLPDIMGNGTYIISLREANAAWEKVQQQALEFPAGSQFRYNQTNYLLLGKIIDKLSGMPFVEYIKTHQLIPAGMKRTASAGFAHFQDVIPHQARGYTYDITGELTTVYAEFPPMLRATAGMSSNATELAHWLIALQSGKIFNDATSLAMLWTPAVLENGKTAGFSQTLNGYALGWQTMGRAEHPAVALVGGNRAALVTYPEDKLAIVVITNLMGAAPENFIDEIAGLYISGMETINGITVATKILDKYVGEFSFEKFSLKVTRTGNHLSLLAGGEGQKPFTLFAKSKREFFAKAISAEFSFQTNDAGNVTKLTMHQGGADYVGVKIH